MIVNLILTIINTIIIFTDISWERVPNRATVGLVKILYKSLPDWNLTLNGKKINPMTFPMYKTSANYNSIILHNFVVVA